eukprot:403369022
MEKHEEQVKDILNSMTHIQQLKVETFSVSSKIDVMLRSFELERESQHVHTKILNYLTPSTVVLQNHQITEIVKFEQDQKGKFQMRTLCDIQSVVNTVLIHQDRVFMDNDVYDIKSYSHIQSIEPEDVTGRLTLNEEYVLQGHQHYGSFQILKWNGQTYHTISVGRINFQKAEFIQKPSHFFQHSPYEDKPLTVYYLFGNTCLNQAEIDLERVTNSNRRVLFRKSKNDPIYDYKFLDYRSIMTMNQTSFHIVHIDTLQYLQHIKLNNGPQHIMIIPKSFRQREFPIILKQGEDNELQIIEVRNEQIYKERTLSGHEGQCILGQIKIENKKYKDGEYLLAVNNNLGIQYCKDEFAQRLKHWEDYTADLTENPQQTSTLKPVQLPNNLIQTSNLIKTQQQQPPILKFGNNINFNTISNKNLSIQISQENPGLTLPRPNLTKSEKKKLKIGVIQEYNQGLYNQNHQGNGILNTNTNNQNQFEQQDGSSDQLIVDSIRNSSYSGLNNSENLDKIKNELEQLASANFKQQAVKAEPTIKQSNFQEKTVQMPKMFKPINQVIKRSNSTMMEQPCFNQKQSKSASSNNMKTQIKCQGIPQKIESIIQQNNMPVPQLVIFAQNLLVQAEKLKSIVDQRINPKVNSFLQESDYTTKNILRGLESKMMRCFSGNQGQDDIKNIAYVQQEVLDYEMKQMQNMQAIQDQLNIFQGALDTIDRLKFPKINITIDVELRNKTILQNFGSYDNLYSQLSEDIIVMQNTNDNRIDLLKITDNFKGGFSKQLLFSNQIEVEYIFLHQSRVIINHCAYDLKTGNLLFQFTHPNAIVGGVEFNMHSLFLSHDVYGKISLWDWENQTYNLKKTFNLNRKTKEKATTMLQRNPFNENQFFGVQNKSSLYELQFDYNDSNKCRSHRICGMNVKTQIIDYRIVSSQHILTLFTNSLSLDDYQSTTSLQVINLNQVMSKIILPSGFNIESFPIALIQSGPNQALQAFDLIKVGFSPKLINFQNVKMLGQIQTTTNPTAGNMHQGENKCVVVGDLNALSQAAAASVNTINTTNTNNLNNIRNGGQHPQQIQVINTNKQKKQLQQPENDISIPPVNTSSIFRELAQESNGNLGRKKIITKTQQEPMSNVKYESNDHQSMNSVASINTMNGCSSVVIHQPQGNLKNEGSVSQNMNALKNEPNANNSLVIPQNAAVKQKLDLQVINLATMLVSDCSKILEILREAIPRVENFLSDCQTQAKRVVSDIELKIVKLQTDNASNYYQNQNTSQKNYEQIKSMREQVMELYENVNVLNRVSISHRESYVDQNFSVRKKEVEGCAQVYEKILQQLPGLQDTYALKVADKNEVDIVRIEKVIDSELFTKLFTIRDQKIKFCIQHGDRILCNEKAYSLNTFQFLCDVIWQQTNTEAIAMTDDQVIMSHDGYVMMSHWKWDGVQYKYTKRKIFQNRKPEWTARLLKKNPFVDDFSFYVHYEDQLQQIFIDRISFCSSRMQLITQRVPNLLDYYFTNQDSIVLYCRHGIQTYDLKLKQFKLTMTSQDYKLNMIVPINFDMRDLPVVIVNNKDVYETVDVLRRVSKMVVRGMDSNSVIIGQNTRAASYSEERQTYALGFVQGDGNPKLVQFIIKLN